MGFTETVVNFVAIVLNLIAIQPMGTVQKVVKPAIRENFVTMVTYLLSNISDTLNTCNV